MKKYLTKVNHILPTLLYILTGTVVSMILLRWILFQLNIFELSEEIWSIWMPLALPWIPITIWLRPKLRILIRKRESDRLQFGFQLAAWFVLGVPLLISQSYLNSALGDMVKITNADQVPRPQDKFYTIENYMVLPHVGSSDADVRSSGKHNEYLEFNIYFVVPIAKDSLPKSLSPYTYWYGVKFHKQISNRLSGQEKELKYSEFYKECIAKMDHYKYYDIEYFRRVPKSSDFDGFQKAIEKVTHTNSKQLVILTPKNDRFEDRNGNKLVWIFGSAGIGIAFFLFCLIWPRYSVMELDRQHRGTKPKSDDIIQMLKYLIPKQPHFATSIILDINVVVFVVMIFCGIHFMSPNAVELMNWGANRRAETTSGEWWRLLTSMFVHGGVMHLIFNIYGLVVAGSFLETIIGARRFSIIYVASGLAGSVASIIWFKNSASVGASGAIFGLLGAILSLLLTDRFPRESKKTILYIFGPYVVLNLLIGFTGGIDNAAHIGGLLCGAIIGLIVHTLTPKQSDDPSAL